MRSGGVLQFFLAIALWSGLAQAEQPFLMAPCDRQLLLAQMRNRDFENAVPVHPQSLAARYPDLYKRVMTLKSQYPSWEVAFPAGIVREMPYTEANERVIETHRLIAKILRDLIGTLGEKDEDAEYFLEYSARLFDVDPPPPDARWVRRLQYTRVERVRSALKNKVMLKLVENNYHGNMFHSMASHIHTSWGEVRAAFLVPNLQGSNLVGEDLDEFTIHFPRFKLGDNQKALRQTNVDVLWKTNGGLTTLHFGEVKTYSRPLHVGDHWLWEPLLEQLDQLERLASLSNSMYQVWAILINGVTEEAQRELKARGYEVLGPVVPAPVAAH